MQEILGALHVLQSCCRCAEYKEAEERGEGGERVSPALRRLTPGQRRRRRDGEASHIKQNKINK